MRTFIRLLLLAALVPASSGAQEPGTVPSPLVVSVDELVLKYYRPVYDDVDELESVAGDLFGRQFWLRENGGAGVSDPIENMRLLGNRILVYDVAANVERILAGLKEMDAPGEPAQGAVAVQEVEYRPRFVHLETIHELLRPSEHQVILYGQPTRNYVVLEERGVVLMRDTPERLAAMRAAIAAVDVPPPRVRLRFQILRQVSGSTEGEQLPDELARALAALLPHGRFERVGTAVLESAVLPDTALRAQVSEEHEVQLVVRAFDVETGTLSTSSCELFMTLDGDRKQMFQASPMLRGGERTILGASGGLTDFLVIDVESRQ